MAKRGSGELDVEIVLYQKDKIIGIIGSAFVPAFVPA